ncbi:uncharacterized protein B0T23DRAFT_381961 [Neurospora hispaniola]|uniref:Transmembrane protein n=1 Tax=Neurospora hispaniola TaxID=588809 RepID=A0AAJ0I5A3_9PEZI|nr:hypothetical protein B0T23DRAFT_381961 [Neurospora hispaniola]
MQWQESARSIMMGCSPISTCFSVFGFLVYDLRLYELRFSITLRLRLRLRLRFLVLKNLSLFHLVSYLMFAYGRC